MEAKLKLMRTPRARITKNGKMIDVGISVPVEVIKETYRDPRGVASLEDVIGGRTSRMVHWKLDNLLWDALDKMDLTPHWYGEWTVEVGEITPDRFKNTRTGEDVIILQFSVIEPKGSKGGIKIGDSGKLEFIDASGTSGDQPDGSGDKE